MKEPEPVLTADLFPEVHDGLVKLLRDLSEEEWVRPTANPNWTVKPFFYSSIRETVDFRYKIGKRSGL